MNPRPESKRRREWLPERLRMALPAAMAALAVGAPLLLFILALQAAQWLWPPPAPPPPPFGLQRVVDEAVAGFDRLPDAQRAALRASLEGSLQPISDWVESINARRLAWLCIGEDHVDETRRFVADRVLGRLDLDALLLEATGKQTERLRRRAAGDDEYVPLLDADVSAVLRASIARNPGLRVAGIEETGEQRAARQALERPPLRDASIAANFWGAFRPGERHAALYGANHCADRERWLYRLVRDRAAPGDASQMLNARVVGTRLDEPLEAFVRFLDRIGVERRTFAIADIGALDPRIREWFWMLEQTWGPYRAVVVYRDS